MNKIVKALLTLSAASVLSSCSCAGLVEPVNSDGAPVGSSSQSPVIVSSQDSKQSSQQPASSSQPVSSQQPSSSSQQPVSSSQPVSSQQPSSSSQQPTSSKQPTSSTSQTSQQSSKTESSQPQPTSTQPVTSQEPSSSSSVEPGPGGDDTDEGFTLYFRDAKWWNKDAAATFVSVDGGDPTAMTHIEYVEEAGYNYWSIVLDEEPFFVSFFRYGTDSETLVTSYWGAKTEDFYLANRGENDMVDISASAEAWEEQGQSVQGVWAKYDPNAEPEIPDVPEEGIVVKVDGKVINLAPLADGGEDNKGHYQLEMKAGEKIEFFEGEEVLGFYRWVDPVGEEEVGHSEKIADVFEAKVDGVHDFWINLQDEVWAVEPQEPVEGIEVSFSVTHHLEDGQSVYVVGDWNGWKASEENRLAWHDGDVWSGKLIVPAGEHEFKYVIAGTEELGTIDWDTLNKNNQKIVVSNEEAKDIVVKVDGKVINIASLNDGGEDNKGHYRLEMKAGEKIEFFEGEEVLGFYRWVDPVGEEEIGHSEKIADVFEAKIDGQHDFWINLKGEVWAVEPKEPEVPVDNGIVVKVDGKVINIAPEPNPGPDNQGLYKVELKVGEKIEFTKGEATLGFYRWVEPVEEEEFGHSEKIADVFEAKVEGVHEFWINLSDEIWAVEPKAEEPEADVIAVKVNGQPIDIAPQPEPGLDNKGHYIVNLGKGDKVVITEGETVLGFYHWDDVKQESVKDSEEYVASVDGEYHFWINLKGEVWAVAPDAPEEPGESEEILIKVNGKIAEASEGGNLGPEDKAVYSIELKAGDKVVINEGAAVLGFYHWDSEENKAVKDSEEYEAAIAGKYFFWINIRNEVYVSAPAAPIENGIKVYVDSFVQKIEPVESSDPNNIALYKVELEEGETIVFRLDGKAMGFYRWVEATEEVPAHSEMIADYFTAQVSGMHEFYINKSNEVWAVEPKEEEPEENPIVVTINEKIAKVAPVEDQDPNNKAVYQLSLVKGDKVVISEGEKILGFYHWDAAIGASVKDSESYLAEVDGDYTFYINKSNEIYVAAPEEPGEPEDPEEPTIQYVVNFVGQDVRIDLIPDGKDLQDRDQFKAEISVKAGDNINIFDLKNEVGFAIANVEGWSFGGKSDVDETWKLYLQPTEGGWKALKDFEADVFVKRALGNDSIYFGLKDSGEPEESEEPEEAEFAFNIIDKEKIEMGHLEAKDGEGRDQYKATVSIKAGDNFNLWMIKDKLGFAVAIDGYSFGGDSLESEAWKGYIEAGEGGWKAIKDFEADVYFKTSPTIKDYIYFGLKDSGEPEEPEETIVYAFNIIGKEKIDMHLLEAKDGEGRDQYKATVSIKEGNNLNLWMVEDKLGFAVAIDGFSFGGDSLESEAWKEYLQADQGGWKALKDFEADVYFKTSPTLTDYIYFGLVESGEPEQPEDPEAEVILSVNGAGAEFVDIKEEASTDIFAAEIELAKGDKVVISLGETVYGFYHWDSDLNKAVKDGDEYEAQLDGTYKFYVNKDGETWVTEPKAPVDPEDLVETEFKVTVDAGFGRAVYVVGDFNNWTPSKENRMECGDENVWSIKLHLEEGKYGYKFVIANYDDQDNVDWTTIPAGEPSLDNPNGNLIVEVKKDAGEDPVDPGEEPQEQGYVVKVNGTPIDQAPEEEPGEGNKAKYVIALDKDAEIVFTQGEIVIGFYHWDSEEGKAVKDGDSYVAGIAGQYTFYINDKDEIYVAAPVDPGEEPQEDVIAIKVNGETAEFVDIKEEESTDLLAAQIELKKGDKIVIAQGETVYGFYHWDDVEGKAVKDGDEYEAPRDGSYKFYVNKDGETWAFAPADPVDPSELIETEFKVVYESTDGRSVYLAGDFNDWSIDDDALMECGEGNVWAATLKLAPGKYAYKFIIFDGKNLGSIDFDTLNEEPSMDNPNGNRFVEVKAEAGEEPAAEGKYAIYSKTDSKVLTVLNKRDDTDYQGRDQYEGQITAKAGDVIQLYDLENKAGWIPVIEGWSFGGKSDTDTAYAAYLEASEDGWTVLQDFTASIFAKFAYQNDSIYFGLVAE